MRIATFLALPALVLAGCSTVENETRQSFTSDTGFSYEVRTRTMQGPQGSYVTSDAIVGGISTPCRIDSPGDCEAAARRSQGRFDGSR